MEYSGDLILDDHAMMMLECIAEEREDVKAVPHFDPRAKLPPGISNVCRMGETLIDYIFLLLFMRDVEPHRSMAWHVRLSADQLGQIESLSKRHHDFIRLVEDTKFEYGYPPAMIIERAYRQQYFMVQAGLK